MAQCTVPAESLRTRERLPTVLTFIDSVHNSPDQTQFNFISAAPAVNTFAVSTVAPVVARRPRPQRRVQFVQLVAYNSHAKILSVRGAVVCVNKYGC